MGDQWPGQHFVLQFHTFVFFYFIFFKEATNLPVIPIPITPIISIPIIPIPSYYLFQLAYQDHLAPQAGIFLRTGQF